MNLSMYRLQSRSVIPGHRHIDTGSEYTRPLTLQVFGVQTLRMVKWEDVGGQAGT